MSVGGAFGMREDDEGEAFTDVVNFGIVCVLSAGNDGDIPYIVAGPAATPEVLALAATNSVVAFGIPVVVNSPASIAGELRADRAAASTTSVWDASNPLAVSISFGTYRLNTNQSYKKKIVVRNYSSTPRTYTIANTYRDAPNLTGVTITAPASISVPANGAASFTLSLTVNASSLPVWTLNGGPNGSNGELLNTVEYAGYLSFTSGTENAHIPWHILPHKAANVQPSSTSVALGGNPQILTVTNGSGAVGGLVDIFSLTGRGTQFPASELPAPGADLRSSICRPPACA